MPPGGPQGAPVPSPLYPWMRSQFGEFADGESAVEGGEYELNMSWPESCTFSSINLKMWLAGKDTQEPDLGEVYVCWRRIIVAVNITLTWDCFLERKRGRQTYTRYQTLELEKEFHFNR